MTSLESRCRCAEGTDPGFPHGPLLRGFAALDEPRTRFDRAVHVTTARVVLADYALVQHDFPHLSDAAIGAREPGWVSKTSAARAKLVRAHIDAWLLRETAWLSLAQASQSNVNTPVERGAEQRRVARPPRYGRAIVAPVLDHAGQHAGLVDLKGAGVFATPRHGYHSTGLMLLSEALADLSFHHVIDAIFRHAQTQFRCLPVYAIIDLGFDALDASGRQTAAALQVRRAHRRPSGGNELPHRGSAEQGINFEIELLLRHYGVSSANRGTELHMLEGEEEIAFRYGDDRVKAYSRQQLRAFARRRGLRPGMVFEAVNIQHTREISSSPSSAQVLDFGHFEVRERFDLPLLSLVRDRVMGWGGALGVDDPLFPQPVPGLALPCAQWGRASAAERASFGRPPGVRRDRPGMLAHSWAQRWRAGEWGQAELCQALEAFLATATTRWADG